MIIDVTGKCQESFYLKLGGECSDLKSDLLSDTCIYILLSNDVE